MKLLRETLLIISLVLFSVVHAEDVDLKDLNFEKFLKLASADKINHKNFSQEEAETLYRKNKKDIWSVENEREFWKKFTPLVLSHDDKEFVRSILADRERAAYGSGVMFGWTPMVWAPLKSKLPYVLQLTYFSDGVTGLKSFYKELEKEIESKDSIDLETKNRQHPFAKYNVLTGLVCCLPKVSGRTEKLILATVTMEYFEKLFEKFLIKEDPENNDMMIMGLRNGLFNYYFYPEDIDNPPSRKNTDFWPNKEEFFDVRSYYTELAAEGGELSDEEGQFVERFRNLQRILGR